MSPSKEMLEEHYQDLKEKKFFPAMLAYMLSGILTIKFSYSVVPYKLCSVQLVLARKLSASIFII